MAWISPRRTVEVDLAERRDVAESLGDVPHLEQRCGRRVASRELCGRVVAGVDEHLLVVGLVHADGLAAGTPGRPSRRCRRWWCR